MNRDFYASAARVVDGCDELSISFVDKEEKVLSSTIRILDQH